MTNSSAGVDMRGYCVLYRVSSELIGESKHREIVRPGAFTRSILSGRAITLNIDHDRRQTVASTADRSLKLYPDGRGVYFECDGLSIPPGCSGMSFRFSYKGARYRDNGSICHLVEARLVHVSILTHPRLPAYPQTLSTLEER